jgi:hypothetical protein
MDNALYDMIFKRKSFHLFRNVGTETITDNELVEIQNAYKEFSSLCPEIRTAIQIVPAKNTSCKRGEEFCILMYSEKKDGYLQNIGYLGEQLDLYLVSKNIGTLWFGIGKPEEQSFDGLDFIIMIAIHKISDIKKYRKDMFKSKRKQVEEIWKGPLIEGVSEIVRFAPSACNSQPWFVEHQDTISVFRYKKPGKRGIMPADKVSYYNRIDMGIFLCFMELCMEHQGMKYQRELFQDSGSDDEMTLNAVYKV